MSTALATLAAVLALGAAGLVPVGAAVGPRWALVPLAPLGGAVLAALAATASLSFGGALLSWFVGLALVAAVAVFILWVVRPDLGPWSQPAVRRRSGRARHRSAGIIGFVAVAASCAWSLRALRSPTVGFDARSLWLMRPGWFLQSHAQLLVDMRLRGLVLFQTAYPPLVSAATAVAWRITGVHTARLGVTTMAVLNACALAAAALAVVDCGRAAALGMVDGSGRAARHPDVEAVAGGLVDSDPEPAGTRSEPAPWAPMVAGVLAAVLLVFVAAGVTEPFLTNGYADPLWSLAAVGAVAFGLQSRSERPGRAAAAVLILVAGLSKNEGLVTALALVALLAFRSVGREGWRGERRRWVAPAVLAVAELAVLAWWPLLMHAIGARGASTTFTLTDVGSRSSAVVHGMSPYLHVLVLALPLSVVGALTLTPVRRRAGVGNDLWAWAALAVGLVAVGAALVTGSGAIVPWIRSTVHRITEYPILEAWWIIAVWAVVGASGTTSLRRAPAHRVTRATRSGPPGRLSDPGDGGDPVDGPGRGGADLPVGTSTGPVR